jgi:hypothetical protein
MSPVATAGNRPRRDLTVSGHSPIDSKHRPQPWIRLSIIVLFKAIHIVHRRNETARRPSPVWGSIAVRHLEDHR